MFPRFAGALLCILAQRQALAQRMSGVVHDTSSATTLAGAVVTALDSLKQPLSRALSDGAGRYAMPLAPGATQLRVVRLGYQPRTITLPRQRAPLLVLDVYMHRAPTLLSTVVVNDRPLCDGERAAALSLWEQARAGLLAAIVARDALPAQTTIMGYQRTIATGNRRVTQQTEHLLRTKTSRPFLSADEPRLLAERGYVEDTPQALRFKAPDADVLLDDSFAQTHCFSVRTPNADHLGAIGLAFEPARGRDTLVDVSGTLWIESGVPALRSLEFTWTDRQGILKRGGAGGDLRFHTMANGVSFIEIWTLRLPVVEAARSSRAARLTFSAPFSLRETSETGGIVLDAEWPDGSTFKTSLEPLTGLVTEHGSQLPLAGVMAGLEANGEAYATDSAGRFTIFPALPGRYMVQVIDTTYAGFIPPRSDSREVEIVAGEPVDLHVELAARIASLSARCKNTTPTSSTLMLLGRLVDSTGAETVPAGVRVSVAWPVDSVSGKLETRTASVDDAGRFMLCGVPRDRDVTVGVLHKDAEFSSTSVVIPANRPVATMQWIMDFKALANTVVTKRSGLRAAPPSRTSSAF
jgi:hypothetical protein